MNASQLHLMLNHVPVLGTVFAVVALIVGLWLRRAILLRFGLFTLVAITLVAVPVYFSGHASEETVEHLAGVPERAIERHEGLAGAVTLALAVLGSLALFGVLRFRKDPLPGPFAAVVLVGALALSGMLAWTAHLGGQIRHDELRGATTAATQAAGDRTEAADDDD